MASEVLDEKAIFNIARAIGSPNARADYLRHACGTDSSLYERVQILLRAYEEQASFLESPAAVGAAGTVDQPAPEKLGTAIGPYKLLQQIGEGGMGVVFMAEQTEPVQRKVALKVIKPGMDSRQVIARFEAERQALALMDHVNIARVFDGGTTGGEPGGVSPGRPYFVMELVHGVPITKYCDDNHLTPRERLELFVPVCQAIQHAHQKGIIHRDVKPSNVLVTLYDGKPVPKVIDFGVAKATEQKLTERTLFTQYGTMVGTLEYMSPEQAEMSALGVDTRSDIYSLGVLLYELLTGSTPLTHKRMKEAAYAEILRMIKEEEPPKPSTRLSDSGEALASISANRHTEPAKLTKLVRGELDWIVMKTLDKDRNRRYETAKDFAADVQRYLGDEPVQACPPSAWYRFRKLARRNKRALATMTVVAVAVLLTMMALAVSNVLIQRETAQKEEALNDKTKALAAAQASEQNARIQEGLAKANADKAESEGRIAKAQEKIAKQEELTARRRFYAAQMNLAMQAWEAGHPARMLQLLESQRPRFDQDDLRGFEWYYLWRLCQGAYRFSLPTLNYDNASAIAISPDGKTLASGYGRTVRLWDAATGRQTGELPGHSNLVGWLAISPDGKTLASSDETQTVKLWDLATAKQRATLQADEVVKGLLFTADSQTLVLCGKRIRIWDLAGNHEVATLGAPDDKFVWYAAVAPDGTMVAASRWNSVRIWMREGNEWREAPPLTNLGGNAPLAISPDGKLLAVGSESPRLFDLASRQERTALHRHTGPVYAITFAGEGKRLVSAGQDRTVRIWDVATGQQQGCIANPGPVYGLALTPDASVVAAMGTDAIRVWDVASPTPAVVLRQAAAQSLASSPDGKTLAFNGPKGTTLWDPVEGRELAKLGTVPPRKWPFGLAFSPDGKSLATSGIAGDTIDVWDVVGRRLAVLKGIGYELAYSPDGKLLAAASDKGAAEVWDLASQQRRYSLPVSQTARCVAFSPDGKIIAAGGQFGIVKLFDAESGRELSTLQRFQLAVDYAYSLAFSPDGGKLATGNRQGVVHIWDVATNQLDVALIGHTDAVRGLAFTDGGRTLATASEDRTLRLWDVSTGQERIALKGHESGVRGVAFASDGALLASSGVDGTVRLWRIAVDADARARKREVDPDDAQSPAARNELGDRLWQHDRTAEAEAAYRQALERLEKLCSAFPIDPTYQQEQVRSLLSLGLLLRVERASHPDAESARLRARDVYRKLSPQHQEALFFAYEERHRKLNVGSARQTDRTCSQMIELIREDDVGWLTRASHHLANCADPRLRDPVRALELARQADAVGKRRLDDAFAAFYKAIELDPKSAKAHNSLGQALRTQGRLDEAIDCHRKAIDLEPKSPSGQNHLGYTLEVQGKFDEAIACYRRSIELDAKSAWAPNAIRRALMKQGWDLANHADPKIRDPKRAVAASKEAVEVAPHSHLAWQYLGWVQYRAGNWKASIEALETSCKIQNPGDCGQWIVMSLAHWKLANEKELPEQERDRHKTEARRWYDQAAQQIDSGVAGGDSVAQAIRVFRVEAAELLGITEKPK